MWGTGPRVLGLARMSGYSPVGSQRDAELGCCCRNCVDVGNQYVQRCIRCAFCMGGTAVLAVILYLLFWYYEVHK